MAKDDMEIIIYKILCYLYECMKAGVRPRAEDMGWDCQMFTIPQPYWDRIMKELIANGFVDGFTRTVTKSGVHMQMNEDAGITFKGREFLRENSGMKAAKSYLGKAFVILLEGITSDPQCYFDTRKRRDPMQIATTIILIISQEGCP